MKRLAVLVGLFVVAGLGLAGCGTQSGAEVSAEMGAEGQALAAMGFHPDDMVPASAVTAVDPAPSRSAAAPRERREALRQRREVRVLLRRNTLHGEAVVQTKDGTKTVLVQRGEVTAVDGDSITVRSTDGYTLTWKYAADLLVVERRTSIQPDQVKVGDRLGIAGTKDGDDGVARLIVIPAAR
ncbi:MAG TPA: hypothetical protein VI011_20875 [Asanoa sp.]|jgi:hypothetical protein